MPISCSGFNVLLMGDKFEVASDSGEGWVMSDEGDCLIEMSLWDVR